jgi:hypothetical protein
VNTLEQAAFGWQCLLGALTAARRPAVWGPWAALFALHVLVVAACALSAHPALSWLMAPLLRWVGGEDVLRYPELFRRLPSLSRDAGLVIGALAAPVAAGVSTRLFERHYRELPLAAAGAWAEGGKRAVALLVAGLPLAVAALGLHTMLPALEGVRLSGLARAVAPFVAGAALLFLRASLAYVPALVVLGRRSGPRALADVSSTWVRGFVPAAVALLLLSPLAALGTVLVSLSGGFVNHGAPEAVAALVLARAATDALGGMLASGAVTLAWIGAVDAPAELR